MKKITFFKNGNRHQKKWQGNMLFIFMCLLSFSSTLVRGQASSYVFSNEVGTYQQTSATATTLPVLLADTSISTALNIGFNFVYEGVTYTQFKATSNGVISFNATGTNSLTTNSFADLNADSRPIIAPLWDDMDGNATGGSLAAYEVTGTAPNRVMTMEWRNWEWNYNSTSPVISFQVKLYETTNVIEFAYRQESGSVNSASATIGIGSLASTGTTNFLNITNLATLTAGTTSTTSIATKPVTGQILRFTPPACMAPAILNAANMTDQTANLSWTSQANLFDVVWGPSGFVIGGADNNLVNGITTTSYALSGLNASTNYQYYVRTNCGGGTLSAWSGPFAFRTTQVLATLPFNEQFENTLVGWELANAATNKWFVGTAATGGTGNSMYISNNNGVAYAYTLTTTQVSHAYRDIQIPSGAQSIDLSFDWKAKGEGFTGTFSDYITVWAVPTSFLPVAGTAITEGTGRVRVARLNNLDAFTNANYIISVAGFTGTTRLVFEWRNNGSAGTQPPGAIDNVNVSVTACPAPDTLTAGNATNNSVNLSWNSAGNSFTVAYGPVGFTPGVDEGGRVSGITSTQTVLGSLNASTSYQYYVRQDCGAGVSSTWAGPLNFITEQVVATLPLQEDFESTPVNWTLLNGSQTNKWVLGTATANGGQNSIYISNDGGTTNAYTHTASVVHAFRNIQIPTGTTNVDISFDWHGVGEACCDYVRAWVVPLTFVPTTGTQITDTNGKRIGGTFNQSADFATFSGVTDLSAYAGQVVRLVFEWRNDGGTGTMPAGAVDNVKVKVTSCAPPTALAAANPTGNSAALSWTSTGNLFDIAWGVTGFTLEGTGSNAENGIAGTSFNLTGLNPVTNYQYYVRRDCGSGDKSIWVGPFAFRTTQILGTLPYTEDFEGTSNWEFSNASTNKWVIGTAANGGSDNAMYISNDSGVSHAYTLSGAQVSHAYRDIVIPSGTQTIDLSFDWKAVGEGFTTNRYDYVSVWLVPASVTPVAGTQTATGTGRVRVVQYLNNQADYANATYVVDASSFTSGTARLLFEWTNDFGGGAQTPGAIDNINVSVTSCAPPTALTATNPTTNSVNLSWTSPGTSFTVAYGPVGFTPEVSEDGMVSGITATQTVLGNLNPSTPYQYYVRRDCGSNDSSLWVGPINFITSQVLATLPFTDGFENSPIDWTLLNGAQANKWISGTGHGGGDTAIYISNDGVTNGYVNTASVVHAFRNIQIPAGTTNVDISFDWHGAGQLCCDYIRAWVVPMTFTPTPGTQIVVANGKKVGANFNVAADFTSYSGILDVTEYAGQTVRLVFEWTNDGSTFTQPAGAIDNVSVKATTCNPVTNLGIGTVTMNSAQLTWTSTGTAFDIEWGTTGFALGSGNAEVVTNATNLVLSNLAEGAYQFYVRQDCGSETSVWAGPFAFTIGYCRPISTNLTDYVSNFTTTNALTNISHVITSIPGGNGYASYRDMIIQEAQGESFDFSSTYVGGSNRIKIWVDWNNNGNFETSELLYNIQNATLTKTGTIAIPATMPVGDYVMRVRSRFSTTDVDACESATYGDARDYTLTVAPALGVENPNKMASFKYYPNPVANVLNLSYEGEITNVAVFNMLGQQVITKSINASSGLVDMSNLAAGNYIVKVNADGMTKTIKVVKQ